MLSTNNILESHVHPHHCFAPASASMQQQQQQPTRATAASNPSAFGQRMHAVNASANGGAPALATALDSALAHTHPNNTAYDAATASAFAMAAATVAAAVSAAPSLHHYHPPATAGMPLGAPIVPADNVAFGGDANNSIGMLGRTAAQPGGHMPHPIAAPRPVSAQQLAPPAWMLAALPLEVLLGLAAPTYKQKIINDVFFTQEERHESPQLTPVSEIEDTRDKLLAPGDDSSDDDDMTTGLDL
ncbi:hypothetical protein EC988_007862, partial [Linderina pennispora]